MVLNGQAFGNSQDNGKVSEGREVNGRGYNKGIKSNPKCPVIDLAAGVGERDASLLPLWSDDSPFLCQAWN